MRTAWKGSIRSTCMRHLRAIELACRRSDLRCYLRFASGGGDEFFRWLAVGSMRSAAPALREHDSDRTRHHAAVVTALGLSMRAHRRRQYAPNSDRPVRDAAEAIRSACAARFAQRLVWPLGQNSNAPSACRPANRCSGRQVPRRLRSISSSLPRTRRAAQWISVASNRITALPRRGWAAAGCAPKLPAWLATAAETACP